MQCEAGGCWDRRRWRGRPSRTRQMAAACAVRPATSASVHREKVLGKKPGSHRAERAYKANAARGRRVLGDAPQQIVADAELRAISCPRGQGLPGAGIVQVILAETRRTSVCGDRSPRASTSSAPFQSSPHARIPTGGGSSHAGGRSTSRIRYGAGPPAPAAALRGHRAPTTSTARHA